ncbi:hypothetical protein [Alicyclobacillus sp. ALC3]|uniref:hypothetical protein n=1 Tax=Alicyclobacillus sp. ALC3 TaxID=2796143 RepID=UPI00237A06E0|nr:hypothetical protein [Alicyclobacillus sp. ALC3]WDL98101.1 hypothetical protein JC200_05210 [Alicyclobacillus sp. ALC3]
MPAFIMIAGPVSVSTPQQSALGVSIGINSAGNWDANMKFNTAEGGNFGVMSSIMSGFNIMLDNFEVIDGVINTNDVKVASTVEF